MTPETRTLLATMTQGHLTHHEHQWFLGCMDALMVHQVPIQTLERRKTFRLASRTPHEELMQRAKRKILPCRP